MSLSPSKNCHRRSSFPPLSPPVSKQPKRYSSPFPVSNRLDSMHQKRDEAKEEKKRIENGFYELKNPKGRQYSRDENRMLLCFMYGLMFNKGMEEKKAINFVSSAICADPRTLFSLVSNWKISQEVPFPDTTKTGKGNPMHPLYIPAFSIEIECEVHRIIEEYNQNKGFCDTADIQCMLKDNFNIEISRNGLARRLHQLGYQWGRSRAIGGMTRAARIARGVIYMKELALAIEEEKSGDSVLTFTDESYVNVRHKIQYTWYSIYSPQTNEVGGQGGKGKREIILHAITKFGLLGTGDFTNPNLCTTLPVGEESAQHFFIGGYIGNDYHKNMDDEFFINWTKNRFIPAFKAKFPNKKCILILDNASYHHAIGPNYMKLAGSKKELIEKLNKLNVTSIKVEREGKQVEFKQSTWNKRGGKFSPTVKELNDYLKLELPKHPQYQTTEIQKLFDKEGWQLIYTPPYTPEVQPIEKVWAYVKSIVASHFSPNRTATTLHLDIIMAFYGNPYENHAGVTAEFCQSVINHAFKWCNQFINDHIFSGGNLSSLAQWLNEHPQEEVVEDENEDIKEGAIEEEDEEQFDIFAFPVDDD